jgi:hypothetical protein
MRLARFSLGLIATFCVAATCAAQTPKPKEVPSAVRLDKDKLVYATDDRGNRVPDFSYAGYRGADATIPNVPVRVFVSPKEGDQTSRIQTAIDYIASREPDANGFRGAVLLQPGIFEVAGGLKIRASGVVLRGSGAGEHGTTILATGHDRRTLIVIEGKDDRQIEKPAAIPDLCVPVNASSVQIRPPLSLSVGDTVIINRPCTPEWIESIGMNDMGGERHGFRWRPGSRELNWDRIVTKIEGNSITFDAPITCALDSKFGGATIAKYAWPGRIQNVGLENLRLESTFDSKNLKDESHSWFAVTMEGVRDAWVRQVTFTRFAGSAVALWETCSRITVEDCKSLSPVSEIAGWRRHTFFTSGQQTLFQRCYSEHGRHDFSVGFCSPGPNAFVQCEAHDTFDDSGPIDSWATGVLFDNVRIDGNAISLCDRRFQAQGAGWSSANSMLWQCNASLIRNFSPPGATNWAIGCWATFDGNGIWQDSNASVRPTSLYYAQLGNRIGPNKAESRSQLLLIPSDASSSPTVEEAAKLVKMSRNPMPQLSAWIDEAKKRNPIPIADDSSKSVDAILTDKPASGIPRVPFAMSVTNGWITVGRNLLVGGRQGVMWWRGGTHPQDIPQNTLAITRFVPGRAGKGLTDNLDEVADEMQAGGKVLLEHNYGLWYDRRRDDHERVRRMTGDVWPPFYEQPFARSGVGSAWDGLSKYDLTKYNPWYWDRLKSFADVCDQRGLVLLQQHYFQHNIIEAGAHYVDFPWRTANNINDTQFPEPPPFAGDKRIFLSEPFYDVTHPTRRAVHRAFIRKSLENFPGNSNVIHLVSAEYTGPLHFMEFWLDTIAEWQSETGKQVTIGLSATKDVQDAILADPKRASLVSVIEMKYWWYTSADGDGSAYAPKGGQSLSPRQHQRVWKGSQKRPENATARQIREYREKYPQKAILCDYEGLDGWAALVAGASAPPIRGSIDARLLAAIPRMKLFKPASTLKADQYALAESGRNYLAYSFSDSSILLDLAATDGPYSVRWIDPRDASINNGQSVDGGGVREFTPPSGQRRVLWVTRE